MSDTPRTDAEDALKQIQRLAFENGRMRFLIGEVITTMIHAETFIRTREKMHPAGIDLWCELVNRLQECLDDQNERCTGCGGSLLVTGRNDRTGECVCQDQDDGNPYCQCGNDPYEEEEASGVCSSYGKELS